MTVVAEHDLSAEGGAGARAAEGAHPVDRHVGLQIRLRRKALGMSQERLAQTLGLTFQQVQKYERGSNRVSASKLWAISQAMKTSVAYFYDGLEDEAEMAASSLGGVREFLLSAEGMELAEAFVRLGDGGTRRKLLELVKAIAEANSPKGV